MGLISRVSSRTYRDLSIKMSQIPRQFRKLVSEGKFHKPTSGVCLGFKQANVALIPNHLASEFQEICQLNHGPLPILQVIKNPVNIFTEVPKYYQIQNKTSIEKEVIYETKSTS